MAKKASGFAWFKRKKKEQPPAPRVERVAIPKDDLPEFARMYDAMINASRTDPRLKANACTLWTYIDTLVKDFPKGSKLEIAWPGHSTAEIVVTFPPDQDGNHG